MTTTRQHESLAEKTVPGLHDCAFAILQRIAPAPRDVLDLGAGTGAWATRLTAAGHRLTAVDLDTRAFDAPEIELLATDLNCPFADQFNGRRFQVVTCLEVIEHLENPRNLLRQCLRLLHPDGQLLLTTPNIESVPARLRYLATGQLSMFGRDPARNEETHISPIHTLMFERMVADTGFVVKEHTFNAPMPIGTKPLNRLVSKLVGLAVRGIQGGDCHVFVLEPRVQ